MYRIRPSVQHTPFKPFAAMKAFDGCIGKTGRIDPNQMRWMPMPMPTAATTFISGLATVGGTGDPCSGSSSGFAIHMYAANASMADQSFVNSDGDFLIVPQEGALTVRTEFGVMRVAPKEICVVMRGMRFSVALDGPSRGYVLEVYHRHFVLPDLGPIGSNGLANPQDFLHPVAAYEDRDGDGVCFSMVHKLGGELFEATQSFSPFNVVAYSGNYVPYKYDLRKFCCMNSVTYDHPDPSIYTVLTCPSDAAGVAVADFVIFPPRWMPAEHTFRPPWFHRNCMSEFMGMIWGEYDAKSGGKDQKKPSGFVPGGASLHSPMTSHGPDAGTVIKASSGDLKPQFFGKGLAFMFETASTMRLSEWALGAPHRDDGYQKCWAPIPRRFDPTEKPPSPECDHLMAWRANSSSGGGGAGSN